MQQQRKRKRTPLEKFEAEFLNIPPKRPEPSEADKKQAAYILEQFKALEPAEPPACSNCGAPVCPQCGTRHDHAPLSGQRRNSATEALVAELRRRERRNVKSLDNPPAA